MRLVIILISLIIPWGLAEQQAVLSGIIKTEEPVPESTRVAIHLVNRDNAWQREIHSTPPVAGTFRIETTAVADSELRPFTSGAILFPGLQNEYEVRTSGASYARALLNMYVDTNENEVFDNVAIDRTFIGVASLEEPIGFFSLVYVDRDVTIVGSGTELTFKQGWNVFTVRFPDGGAPVYAVLEAVNDIVLDVFLP